MIEARMEKAPWKGFMRALAGGSAAIALYAGLLAIAFTRMAHVAQHLT